MKKLYKNRNVYVSGGVSKVDDKYRFDYTYNLPTDIIEIVPPQLYKSIKNNRIWYFGYQFKDDVSSKERTNFLHYLKGIGDYKITDSDLSQFIGFPLKELDSELNLQDIGCYIYPLSNRSNLVKTMVSEINRYLNRSASKLSFELVKSAPIDIEFDWQSFEMDYGDDIRRYNDMKKYIEKYLLPHIHSLDYFSLAKNVKPKYRRYITNFLNISEDDAKKLQGLHSESILVVDDINTSGSTIDEILRIVTSINNSCDIYIYTLIGK